MKAAERNDYVALSAGGPLPAVQAASNATIAPTNFRQDSEVELSSPTASNTEESVSIRKPVAGAIIAGAFVGSMILGPVFGVILACGAAYAAT
jgi:hypothetical protein